MFINRELYFAKPEELNDPFDCQLRLPDSIAEAKKIVEIDNTVTLNLLIALIQKTNEIESIFNNKGILSLSRTCRSVLMWTHYADEHKGLCIGFRQFGDIPISEGNNREVEICFCKYYPKNPIREKLIKMITNNKLETLEELRDYCISIMPITKHSPWKYEREVRAVRKKSGVERFHPQEVVEIIFGARMSNEDKQTVLNMLSGEEWEHIKYSEMTQYRDSFRLKKKPIKENELKHYRRGCFVMTSSTNTQINR
jgi:hypothetical protein